MFQRKALLTIVSVALAWVGQSTTSAQTAEEIFRRCNERVHTITERCVQRHVAIVAECSPRIRELLAAGEVEAARALARICITQINTSSRNCIDRIRLVCRECIDALHNLGANELAERLHQNCERAIQVILGSRTRAINAIHSLFPASPG